MLTALEPDRLLPHLTPAPTALLLHGSSALGLANPRSDLDLLALTRGVPSEPGRPFRQQLLRVGGGLVVHVEYLGTARLEPALLDQLLLGGTLDINGPLPRISSALVLHDPEGSGAALVAAFEAWRPGPKLRAKLFADCLRLYGDAAAAQAAGDDEVAELVLRACAHCLAKASLLLNGVQYVSLRWQGHLLRRACLPETAANFAKVAGLASALEPLPVRLEIAFRWLRLVRDQLAASD